MKVCQLAGIVARQELLKHSGLEKLALEIVSGQEVQLVGIGWQPDASNGNHTNCQALFINPLDHFGDVLCQVFRNFAWWWRWMLMASKVGEKEIWSSLEVLGGEKNKFHFTLKCGNHLAAAMMC